jgi:hypothetical protein
MKTILMKKFYTVCLFSQNIHDKNMSRLSLFDFWRSRQRLAKMLLLLLHRSCPKFEPDVPFSADGEGKVVEEGDVDGITIVGFVCSGVIVISHHHCLLEHFLSETILIKVFLVLLSTLGHRHYCGAYTDL